MIDLTNPKDERMFYYTWASMSEAERRQAVRALAKKLNVGTKGVEAFFALCGMYCKKSKAKSKRKTSRTAKKIR